MGEQYPIPKMPTAHTVDAEQLRRVHKLMDVLAWRRQNTPLDEYMAETIDALTAEWSPIASHITRATSEFHARQMRQADQPLPPLHSVGGDT